MPTELERPERLQIMLNADELAAVDDFRFQKRMPSRAAAVRELMKRGLSAEGFAVAAARERSGNFGVLDPKQSESGDRAGDHGNGHSDDHEDQKRQSGNRRSRP
jgi:hypothetical protein